MPLQFNNRIIVRYDEISLKGKNRNWFENLLVENIRHQLFKEKLHFEKISTLPGRIYVHRVNQAIDLSKVFGIHSFSFARETSRDFNSLTLALSDFLEKIKQASSFRVSCQRIDKSYPLKSPQFERELGTIIQKKTNTPVNLTAPQINLQVEITADSFLIFDKKEPGWGGMPFGSAGKLVTLLSDGIDSPVATFLMMRRGVEPVLLHFCHSPQQLQKVELIKAKLEEFSAGKELKFYAFPHTELFKQKFDELKQSNYSEWLCVICKYLMLRRAEEISRRENALGIITGDNLAQVASQTLVNLFSQRQSVNFPVYSPLIAFNKEQTIELARKIGLYELSIIPATGCNPPKKVKTAADPEKVKKIINELSL